MVALLDSGIPRQSRPSMMFVEVSVLSTPLSSMMTIFSITGAEVGALSLRITLYTSSLLALSVLLIHFNWPSSVVASGSLPCVKSITSLSRAAPRETVAWNFTAAILVSAATSLKVMVLLVLSTSPVIMSPPEIPPLTILMVLIRASSDSVGSGFLLQPTRTTVSIAANRAASLKDFLILNDFIKLSIFLSSLALRTITSCAIFNSHYSHSGFWLRW